MDLKLDELKLITDFRLLDSEGQQQLMEYAVLLLGKQKKGGADDQSKADNQCALDKQEVRPETAKEPIFTE